MAKIIKSKNQKGGITAENVNINRQNNANVLKSKKVINISETARAVIILMVISIIIAILQYIKTNGG